MSLGEDGFGQTFCGKKGREGLVKIVSGPRQDWQIRSVKLSVEYSRVSLDLRELLLEQMGLVKFSVRLS